MLKTNIYTIQTEPFLKQATIYTDDETAPKAAILYFHGGGLLYGRREDLPSKHLEKFTTSGYAVIAFDYPLAPAAHLEEIMNDVVSSINDYAQNGVSYIGAQLPYFLLGRSSGAYLILIAGAKYSLHTTPAGILSYYGYGFLCDQWYDTPSKFYKKLPALPESCLDLPPKEIHTVGPLDTHYSVYVYARQTGRWKELIYEGREKFFLLNYSLRVDAKLPCPLFAAHCTGDTDVPYAEFVELCNLFRPKRFITPQKMHDFDRQEDHPDTEKLLNQSIEFMNSKLS